MKKHYIDDNTILMIRRIVKNPYEAGNWSRISYADARKGGYLSTHSGTVDIEVELHPSEYSNFNGCEELLRWKGNERPFLESHDFDTKTEGGYFQNGKLMYQYLDLDTDQMIRKERQRDYTCG